VRACSASSAPTRPPTVGGLGAEPVRDDAWVETVLAATGGRGADVVLELVGAAHFPGNLEAVALKGRIVVVGVGAGTDADLLLLRLMQKRASVRGTVLRARLEEKAAAIRALEHEVVPLLADGRARPVIDSVFPIGDVHAAFDRLESSGKIGKVLVDFD
jgi:NADPH:quinone reductase-like Zn-dependent oxidoreductase